MIRRRTVAALAFVVVVAGAVLAVASAGTITGSGSGKPVRGKGLTAKERNALKIVSVKATGIEPLGVIVTATFKGNIEQALGRGHLKDGIVALILRPKDPRVAFAGVATFGAGAIGLTARKSQSTDVGVVRKGRTITFFVGGPGFENVAKVDVKALATVPRVAKRALQVSAEEPRKDVSPAVWEFIGETIAADEASLPAPTAATSCSELGAMDKQLTSLLTRARVLETTIKDMKRDIEKALPGIERDLKSKSFAAGVGKALALGNALATGPALVLFPPLAFGTALAAVATSKETRNLSEQAQALRDLIRSLKLDLRLADAYLDKVKSLQANIREVQGKVGAFFELQCTKPVLKAITASFDPDSFTTTYTEEAKGAALAYAWAVSIPDDPDCAAGFKGNSPKAHQATWSHKDKSQGGQCNHDGEQVGPRGHIGEVYVDVSNLGWTCRAIYFGTQGDDGSLTGQGSSPHSCSAK